MIAIVYDVMGFLLNLHACFVGKNMNERSVTACFEFS